MSTSEENKEEYIKCPLCGMGALLGEDKFCMVCLWVFKPFPMPLWFLRNLELKRKKLEKK